MVKIYSNSSHQTLMALPSALKCYSEGPIELLLLKMQKGECIPMHKNPLDVLFMVKSGRGTLTVEQARFELAENELAFISSGDDRSWVNEEDAPLELVVIKFLR